jgi:hypothetical protein
LTEGVPGGIKISKQEGAKSGQIQRGRQGDIGNDGFFRVQARISVD